MDCLHHPLFNPNSTPWGKKSETEDKSPHADCGRDEGCVCVKIVVCRAGYSGCGGDCLGDGSCCCDRRGDWDGGGCDSHRAGLFDEAVDFDDEFLECLLNAVCFLNGEADFDFPTDRVVTMVI